MMYLSRCHNEISREEFEVAIQLDDDFLNQLRNIKEKVDSLQLNINSIDFEFSNEKARLLEIGSYPYEDKEIHSINNGEDPLDYYGFVISKHYFPTDDYWFELKPDNVYLTMTKNCFGFSFVKNRKRYDGLMIFFNDWEKYF